MKKILILYTSVGLGHKSIAENIGFQLQQSGYEVKLHDVLKLQEGKLVEFSKKVHEFLLFRMSWLWAWLYTSSLFTKVSLPFRVQVASKNYKGVLEVVEGFQPDMVIATQTSASAIVAYLKQKKLYTGLFGITFSDFHFHPYWTYPEADFYLANIPEQLEDMKRWGYRNAKAYICGTTLKPLLSTNAADVKEKLGIDASQQVVLMSGGSWGKGMNEQFIDNLGRLANVVIIVVCGKNEQVYQKLSALYQGNERIKILGFYSPMDELYSISDMLIAKPGGLTIAEALRHCIPIQIQYWLPAQEELNYQYLLGKNLILPEDHDFVSQATEVLGSNAFRQALKQNRTLEALIKPPVTVVAAIDEVFHKP